REHAFGPIPRPSFNCRYAKTAVDTRIKYDVATTGASPPGERWIIVQFQEAR
ncbi:MAG: hypothetical protein K0R61_3519, partial [Microvirga sp.]|nr:hypothetical protein [Microvirga sp.]